MKQRLFVVLAVAATLAAIGVTAVSSSTGWSNAVRVESIPGTSPDFNYSGLDGCPIEAPDGLSFYMASDRPGGQGGIDIWRATRANTDASWGTPANLGAPVNSSANDFCPTPTQDGRLFFVSTRDGGCGNGDIYVTKPAAGGGWSQPENIGCQANSPGPEFSPSLVELGPNDTVLFFSSARPGGFSQEAAGAAPDHDIYYSRELPDGSFGPAILVNGVNSAADDARPNVRLDGLEMVFDSTRPGGLGGPDIWASSRATVKSPWSTPVNLGPAINSDAGESRASLSAKGERLYFGSTKAGGDGGSDVYVATRDESATGTAASAGAVTPPNTGDGGLQEDGSATMPAALMSLASGVVFALILRRYLPGRTR
jgi:WD40-like Beta Propeller Repeat